MSLVQRTEPDAGTEADTQIKADALDDLVKRIECSTSAAGLQKGAGMGKRRNGGSNRRSSRRQWDADQKLRIVIESLKSPEPNIEICRRHGISEPTLYKWRQQLFDGGRLYLSGTRSSVADLAKENRRLKEILTKTLQTLGRGLGGKSVRRLRRSSNGAHGTDGEM